MDKSVRELSREDVPGERTWENIQRGAILRIADALEAMSGNYQSLLGDVKYLRTRVEDEGHENRHLRARVSALRGVITRMKRRRTR
jgi:hypothetical protein